MSTTQSAMPRLASATQLSGLEKVLLVIPLLGGLVFGLAPLLAQAQFAAISGGTGNDPYVYRLSGAATFGYAVALLLGLLQSEWRPVRLVVIPTLVFNLASLYACAAAIVGGSPTPVVYAILATSIIIVAATAWMLNQHRGLEHDRPDIARWLVYLIAFLAIVATVVGLSLLIAPVQVGQLFGYKGTDDFLYRQGGAAVLGYGVMGYYMFRSRVWAEIRLPTIMALAFNAISTVVAVLELASGGLFWLPAITGLVALITTVGTGISLMRNGK